MVSARTNRRTVVTLGAILVALCLPAPARCEDPQTVTVCQLKADPSAYNHMLVQVTGFVTHGFEDFGLNDPTCSKWPYVWLEYGGKVKSGTMYCCGVTDSRTRPQLLKIEGIPIWLEDDEVFREFDKLIHGMPSSTVHATIIGRFFAGQLRKYPKGSFWGGYGHMGCCSLLAIERIKSVDPHDRDDLDYRAEADQPSANKVGCGYRFLTPLERFDQLIAAQKAAESVEGELAFPDARSVAIRDLAKLAQVDEQFLNDIKQTSHTQGRFVYAWSPKQRKKTYMIVVSRPYWLSFYSKEPANVAWVTLAAYMSSCEKNNSIVRIK